MDDEQCPKCGSIFPASRAWASRTVTMLFIAPALQDLDTRVQCPSCGKIFQATEYRFFGVIPPKAMKISLGLFVLVLLGLVVYFLFIEAP